MRRIIGILMLLTFINNTSQANDPIGSEKVEITPNVITQTLSIEVDEGLTGTAVTVSVFNALGEIVMESPLGLGLNKIDLTSLKEGEYVAVVRENGIYSNKSSFVIN